MNTFVGVPRPQSLSGSTSLPESTFGQSGGSHLYCEQNSSSRENLYAEFQPLVRRLMRQYGDTAERREDLKGEIYYRFCLLIEAYNPERGVPLRPYLVRQLGASVYTYVRQQWRNQQREVSLNSSLSEVDPAHSYDPRDDWDHALSFKKVCATLAEAIRVLPERQRKVLILRYYEDRSFEEIAGRLQIKAASVRSLLRHGINRLRDSAPLLLNE